MKISVRLALEARAAKFARWERVGVELVRANLKSGGYSVIGPGAETKALAKEWLQLKDAQKAASLKRSRKQDDGALVRLLKRIWTIVTFR